MHLDCKKLNYLSFSTLQKSSDFYFIRIEDTKLTLYNVIWLCHSSSLFAAPLFQNA